MKGFKSFHSASSTLQGIEVAHMIRKKQFGIRGKSGFKQFAALAGQLCSAIRAISSKVKICDGTYLKAYENVPEARTEIGRYITFYNTKRPHSSLDRQTPDQAYFNPLTPISVAA